MERVEEYLETIYDIQKAGRVAKTKEIADRLNIKPSSVTEMLNKLNEMGYVEYQPYKGATLTRKGLEVAERIKRNYWIFRRFFENFLGLDEEISDKLSCTLEHVVDENVISKLCSIIASDCQICDVCDDELSTPEYAEDGDYVVLTAPKSLEKLGISPGRKISIQEGDLVVNGERLVIDKGLKRFVLLKPQ